VNKILEKMTDHPVLVKPTEEKLRQMLEKMGPQKVSELIQLREDKIQAEKDDPYRHGYEPFHWKDADEILKKKEELLILGGNRAGKTEYAAKRAIFTLCNKPNAIVWCIHTTSMSSVQMQQNVIWKYIPSEYKTMKKGRVTNIQYSVKNGFSNNSFVFPNGSQCIFMNYSQDKVVIEGGEPDFIWCDELVPLDWIQTLRYRILTRRGRLLVTFTPINGFSQVVKEYVSGCKMKETKVAEILPQNLIHVQGCPPGHMPYIAEGRSKTSGIIWFHSKFNVYSPFDQMMKQLDNKTDYEKKIRAYGWAQALVGSQFPMFSEVHIIDHDKIPQEGTNYMSCDPAGARNWFMLWGRATEEGNFYIYREFPDESFGEWALPDTKPDGREGPAQRSGAGRGIEEYKSLIYELEEEEDIAERYIDPRAGATKSIGMEGGTALTELLDSGDNPMFFKPAAGIKIDQGVSIINDWLCYDQSQPITYINRPKLFISSKCQNLIYSMKEWTGSDGDKGCSKDPIDALRYLAVMDPVFENEHSYKPIGGGSY
jgi:phage terminase large subunit-like protein